MGWVYSQPFIIKEVINMTVLDKAIAEKLEEAAELLKLYKQKLEEIKCLQNIKECVIDG